MRRIYLAGPINRVSDPGTWRTDAEKLITRAGHLAVNPLDYELQDAANVVAWDMRALRRSDAVVAYVPDHVQSVGTCMEIFYAAHDLEIPVCVWGADSPSPWLRHFCLIYPDLFRAVEAACML